MDECFFIADFSTTCNEILYSWLQEKYDQIIRGSKVQTLRSYAPLPEHLLLIRWERERLRPTRPQIRVHEDLLMCKDAACSCQNQDGRNASSSNLVDLYYIKPVKISGALCISRCVVMGSMHHISWPRELTLEPPPVRKWMSAPCLTPLQAGQLSLLGRHVNRYLHKADPWPGQIRIQIPVHSNQSVVRSIAKNWFCRMLTNW